METLEAEFQIVTPMFLGDANQGVDDGIRPPSVKAALRFWWRALNWARFRGQESSDEAALIIMHQEESRLFGSAAHENGGGQGYFLLTVQHESLEPCQPNFNITNNPGQAYLAGMGVIKERRPALPPSAKFRVVLRFKPATDAPTRTEIAEALRVFCFMGGLGSRNRRGFGSVVRLMKDNDKNVLPTEIYYNQECEWLRGKLNFTTETLSAFSVLDSNVLFYKGKSDYPSWEDAMESVGKQLSRYRTNGTSILKDKEGHTIDTAPIGQRIVGRIKNYVPLNSSEFPFFNSDHNPVHDIAKTGRLPSSSAAPRRSIFGIPHPYRFSSLNGTKITFDYVPSWPPRNTAKGRRASPLFIHVTAYTNSKNQVRYRPLLLLFQAQFLPANAQLNVSRGNSRLGGILAPTDYSPITNFLSTHFSAV